jgi:7-keto-8-aminopelargonate synthetase-like enzyme
LVDVLINRARTFLFSTAPTPASAAAALAGVRQAQSEDGIARRSALWERVQELNDVLAARVTPSINVSPSPIAPWIIGDEREAVGTAARLHQGGVFARAVRFPTVARGQARIRFTVTSDHTPAHLSVLATALDLCVRAPVSSR